MLPGLHPGLLIAPAAAIEFEPPPQEIYISTAGGAGNRGMGLFLEVRNGVGPYTYEWSVSAGQYTPTPASGSGTTSQPYVGFSTSVWVDGALSDYQIVGEAYLYVIDAAGNWTSVRVSVAAGQ